MHHEYSWCIMSTHNSSRVLNTHDASWVLTMHHEYSDFEVLRPTSVLICHQMGRYGTWEVFDQTNLDEFSARVFAHFEVSTFNVSTFNVFAFNVSKRVLFQILFWGHPVAPREPPGTTGDRFGGSWDLQGPFWRYSVMKWLFKKSAIHDKSTFQMFPVIVFDETRPIRLVWFPHLLSRPPNISK